MSVEEILFANIPLFFRAFGLLLLLPFGRGAFGILKRTLCACSLSLLFFDYEPRNIGEFELLKSSIIGFICGIGLCAPLALVLAYARSWGDLFDAARGQNLAEIIDPGLELYASPCAALAHYGVWSYLVCGGILGELLRAFSQSLITVPLGDIPFDVLSHAAHKILLAAATLFSIILATLIPIAAFFLLCEIVVGLVSKCAPRLSLSTESFVVKSLAALLLITVWCESGLQSGILSRLALPLKMVGQNE